MSSLGWIDFDQTERDRMQRVLAFFQDRESRDELGLGAIRDSIADHLFPGTSTIQTRLRYMLFIPWLFRRIEARGGPEDQLRREARALEIGLIGALKAGGETDGVIGGRAGANLQRLPSLAYWAGLGAWGIRLFPGSPESYFASVGAGRRRTPLLERDDISAGRAHSLFWNPGLPPEPGQLLERAEFQLTGEEGEFIVDRLIGNQPAALLTLLARKPSHAKAEYIWMHPDLASFPSETRRLVEHARIFSGLMHGAALLYNLSLSELRKHEEWVELYRRELEQWSADLEVATLRAWSLPDFWECVSHPAHSIQPVARRFVSEWLQLVLDGPRKVAGSDEARRLVELRERRLKGAQSRFANHSALDRWRGASGAYRLGFRWPQARTYLQDLADAS